MSSLNAPPTKGATASVWTGNEVLIWGGLDSIYTDYSGSATSYFISNNGDRYNPTTNTWTAMSTTGAPSPRYYSCAVWTGTYMVVWGGNDFNSMLASGALYNPAANTWSTIPTSVNAPAAPGPCMFWTGTYVLVLGNSDSIGRYNPTTNAWLPSANVPPGLNYNINTAIWTGTELWIYVNNTHQIYKYNPNTNVWAAPIAIVGGSNIDPNFYIQSTVWTGTELILYGNVVEGGKTVRNLFYRYNAGSNSLITDINTNIIFNSLVESDVLFLKAGSMIFKWGGSMYVYDGTFGEYTSYSSQGVRIYLTGGSAIPTVYIPVTSVNKMYLYQKL